MPDRFPLDSPLDARRAKRPFFTHARPCESCGEPQDELQWNPEWQMNIGTDCSCVIPWEPIECPELLEVYIQAPGTLIALRSEVEAHKAECAICKLAGGAASPDSARLASGSKPTSGSHTTASDPPRKSVESERRTSADAERWVA